MRTCDPKRGLQILDAAAQLFAKSHYHEVHMDDIASQAGVAKGTVYRYFRDKEDLYLALTIHGIHRVEYQVDEDLLDLPRVADDHGIGPRRLQFEAHLALVHLGLQKLGDDPSNYREYAHFATKFAKAETPKSGTGEVR